MSPAIDITLEADLVAAALEADSERMLEALARGLLRGGDAAASAVALAAREAGIESRSGQLLGSIAAWPEDDEADGPAIRVGVMPDTAAARYAYLLTDAVAAIAPVKGKYLAIPVGENLTGAGVARYASPRDVPDGEFERGMDVMLEDGSVFGGLVFGRWRQRGRGRSRRLAFDALFILVRQAFVQGFDVLWPTLTRAADTIKEELERELAQLAA